MWPIFVLLRYSWSIWSLVWCSIFNLFFPVDRSSFCVIETWYSDSIFILARIVFYCLNLLIHSYCFLRKTCANTRGLFCRFKLSFTKRDLGSILFINLITTYFGAFGIEKMYPFVILEAYLTLLIYLFSDPQKRFPPKNCFL